MSRKLIIGIVLMLLTIGTLSGCTDNYSYERELENKLDVKVEIDAYKNKKYLGGTK